MNTIKIRGGIPYLKREIRRQSLPIRITPHLRYLVQKERPTIGQPHVGSSLSGMLRHVESLPVYSEDWHEGSQFRVRRLGFRTT
jgi:hypothetical protein